MEKKIKIEIEIVENEPNVGCAFYSETGEVLDYNKMNLEDKTRVVEALNAFAQLFGRGLGYEQK